MKRARIYRGTGRNLDFLAGRLRAGELVAVPTETVYGLAADALSAEACAKIFAAKGRPANDPLIVHISSLSELSEIAEPNPEALRLARRFWPGPLTIVLRKKPAVPKVVCSGLPTVAVRMPSHPLLRRLLKRTGRPLAAPSANPFAYVSPTTAEHVRDSLGSRIRHILDGGPSKVGVESTIVDLTRPERPRLLRPGKVGKAELERVLKRKVGAPGGRPARKEARRGFRPSAPGQFERHYSPRTEVRLHPGLDAEAALKGKSDEAWLFFRRPSGPAAKKGNVFWLDREGSVEGAARNLFAVLRRLDGEGFRVIHAELIPADGLGEAVNDRLLRAAAKKRRGRRFHGGRPA